MGLLDLFRPKHKHSNVEVRLDAVRQLGEDETSTLTEVAKKDPEAKVREIALRKLSDPDLLTSLATDERDEALKTFILRRASELSLRRALDTQSDLWHLPNGQILRVFATAHPQGGATWVFENLTEQVDLETRYNTLVKVQGETIDHLSEGVAVFGPDGRIRLSNPAFRILWNITEAQAKPGTHIQALAEACTPSYDRPDGWKRFAEQITSFDDERPSSQGTLELYSNLVLDYAVIPLPNIWR